MKKIIKLISIIFMCFLSINVYAEDYEEDIRELNPEWIEYMRLPEDEKILYEAIPEQYIYKYVPKKTSSILDSYNENFFTLDGDDTLPSYYNLANIDGKRYVNSKNKNQSSLGLCWAFGAIGSLDSNILINGVVGLEEEIVKCNENNTDSVYCKYKTDKELNDYYISNSIACESGNCPNEDGTFSTKTIDNATFSERNIDYLRSKPANASAYNHTSGDYTLIEEKYNLYNKGSQIGAGGSFNDVATYFSYGIAPTRTLEGSVWEKYTTSHNTISLYDLYDNVGNSYQVTNYYNYSYPPSDVTEREKWNNELKENIMKYGSVYVSTTAPQNSSSGSCFYNDTVNGIRLINNTGSCGKTGGHAMQIIGWDDNYEFGYCKLTTITSTSTSYSGSSAYTKEECEALETTTAESTTKRKGIWTEGKGAWILKNSWGSSTTYPYLSFQSTGLGVHGVREVSVVNYENTYNEKNSIIERTSSSITIDDVSTPQTIFKFHKTDNIEYLTRVNFIVYNINKNIKVYVSSDGENYTYADEIHTDYTGMYSVDVEDFKIENQEFYVKFIGDYPNKANAFTINECTYNNSCDTNQEIISTIPNHYYHSKTEEFEITTRSRNIPSGTEIEYKVYNENNDDLTYLFDFGTNYIVVNSNIITVSTTDTLPSGKYYLHTIAGNAIDIIEFEIVEKVEIELTAPYPVFLDDGKVKINAVLSSTENVTNYVWNNSAKTVATIDNEGNLTLLNNGWTNVSLTVDTLYGPVSETIEVYIYKKIHTIDDFFAMQQNQNKRYDAFYLMNDLDFTGVDFSAYKLDAFTGVFNGGFHTIKNVKKVDTTTSSEIGLFNRISGAYILNLKIEDSYFEGGAAVGTVAGFSNSGTIENVYTNATVKSQYHAGGIIGDSTSSTVKECHNTGNISAVATTRYSYAGGIIGGGYTDDVINSYNEGYIYSETQWDRGTSTTKARSVAGGIIGENLTSTIINSYNKGEVVAKSPVTDNVIYSNGLNMFYEIGTAYDISDYVFDSYYIPNDSYTLSYTDYERSLDELKKQSTFNNWDFENVWYIKEDKITPVLRVFPVEAEEVQFNIFSNILNNNYIYNYTYEVLPYTVSSNVNVYSENEELFEVKDNQIITKDKSGTSNIVFKVGEKEFKYPITVKPMMNYSYDKNITNKDVSVDVDINYYNENLANSYLKLNYTIGNTTNEEIFSYENKSNKFTFNVSENNDIKLELYLCNNTCTQINSKNFTINNIDKEKPVITIESNNVNTTLKINVKDNGISGLSENNTYEYAISNSSTLPPMTFNKYTPNETMNNILMTFNMKYLWIKNISDNAGNKASLNDYLIYNLDIINVDAEEVKLDIFSNILNYNKEYILNYEVKPINITNEVIISSEDKSLFDIVDNEKIITKDNSGIANIVFTIGDKQFKYPITIKDTLEYYYNENLTNEDIFVKIQTNYFEGVLDDNTYLKLVYKIGVEEYVVNFDKTVAINDYSFKVSSNNNINLDLYLCDNECTLINNKNFTIDNIDKEKPIINYVADNLNSTLQINIKDFGVSGLSDDNSYKYTISNSNTKIPSSFKEYTPNTQMNNIKIDKEYKYLWLYNISDNAGNKVSNDNYIIYTIDLKARYFVISYYNENRNTILKTEKIKEDDIVLINYNLANYEDDEYIYEFDYWEGYTEGMIATNNINLYPVYKKVGKNLASDIYTINNGYIYNIKLDNINKEYSVKTFKSNLKNYESYKFYESNNAYISSIENIKTSLKFKNSTYEYKIVLAGDVTGDGKVRMNDVMKIANHLVNKNVLIDEYLLAGDVTNDENVKMNDVMKIANALVNGGSL